MMCMTKLWKVKQRHISLSSHVGPIYSDTFPCAQLNCCNICFRHFSTIVEASSDIFIVQCYDIINDTIFVATPVLVRVPTEKIIVAIFFGENIG